MPIKYVKRITKEMVQGDRKSWFVFGDNTARMGKGGQAAVMRGEPNAIGIATKRRPAMGEKDFFSDDNDTDHFVMATDLRKFVNMVKESPKTTFYVPYDGIGTGMAELPQRAPKLYALLKGTFVSLSDKNDPCPWQ